MSTTDNLHLRWEAFSAALAKANRLNKATLFGALSAAGITSVRVSFDGEGDSGQIEDIAARVGEQTAEFPEITVTLYRVQSGCDKLTTQEMTLQAAVEELCSCPARRRHAVR